MTTTVAPPAYRWRWIVLAVVLCADIMDLLDSTVTTIAAPTVRAELGGGTALLQWLSAAYTLAFALGLITGGRLGDLYGRRRMFLFGAVGFTLASVACGLSVEPGMIIAMRVVQGAFGAVLIPQGFGLLREVFDDTQIGTAFSLFGPVMGLSAVGGPILAGALIDADLLGSGWRAIFLINLPIGLAALTGGALTLPRRHHTTRRRLDVVGMLLVGGGLVGVLYPLVQGRELGWPAWSFGILVFGLVLLVGFAAHQIRRERAGRDPLVAPSLFRRRAFTGGLVLGWVFFTAIMGVLLVFGLYIQIGLHFRPLVASLTLAPNALGIVFGSIIGGRLIRRIGRRLLHLGLATVAAGVAALLVTVVLTGGGTRPWQFAPALLLGGVGMGAVFGPIFQFVLAGVAGDEVGAASGTLNAVQQVSNATGAAVIGTLFFTLAGAAHYLDALRVVLPVVVATIAVSFALAYLLPRAIHAET